MMKAQHASKPNMQAVLNALGSDEFEWWTIPGIVEETRIEPIQVIRILADLGNAGDIVKARQVSKEGLALFTSRERLRTKGHLVDRVLGALMNRAV